MASDSKEPKKLIDTNIIKNLFKTITQGMNSIYADTYQNTKQNRSDISNIKNDIDTSINTLLKIEDEDLSNISNITRLYTKLNLKNNSSNSDDMVNGVLDIFNDKSITDNILSSYIDNKFLLDFDNEIDTVCKYMSKLEEALDAKKDSVLSADHFSKEFVSVKNTTNTDNEATFNKRIEEIKNRYKLHELFEDLYEGTAKYGERFVYIVPYKQAFSELLKNNSNALNNIKQNNSKSYEKYNNINPFVSESVIIESGVLKNNNDMRNEFNRMEFKPKDFRVTFDNSGILESAVIDQKLKEDGLYKAKKSLYESYVTEVANMKGEIIKENKFALQNSIDSDLELPEEEDRTSNERIISNNKEKNIKIDVPGCIVKVLPRENIIPIYIDNLCLGYYYLEFQTTNQYYNNSLLNSPQLSHMVNKTVDDSKQEDLRNKLLSNITNTIANQLDANFINSNQDLRKEIYMILKHNDLFNNNESVKVKITFLPESDVVHMKFKTDPKSHRGISDLQKSLLPAKLFSCLYITNTIGILTRGNDKRVYYVKQSVETNISKTMLNVIQQIKQSNFGLRQMESLNHILNLTGRYNDYVIPKSSNGDVPIEFEIMPGQNIEYKTELMNALEEMAINATDVPLELIQARQSLDYAIQLTMTNSKFLRKIYKRQSIVEIFYSEIISRIYNCEFEECDKIDVSLPAPTFLNMTNINQLYSNAKEYANSIAETEFGPNADEEVKARFIDKMVRYHVCTHVNTVLIDKFKSESLTEVSAERLKETEDEE